MNLIHMLLYIDCAQQLILMEYVTTEHNAQFHMRHVVSLMKHVVARCARVMKSKTALLGLYN